MNWDAVAFDWNQVRAFLATVKEGSFSGAARALKTSQPTISRQISSLEESLGVTLFERNARAMTLTQVGHDLQEYVQAMGEAAALISMTAVGRSQDLSGEVTISAADFLSSIVLPLVLKGLRLTAPGIRLRIIAANDIQNLTRHEADIAVRHVRPEQSDLLAKYVGDFHGGVYAAPSYLDRAGRPQTPADLEAHAFVGDPEPEQLLAPLRALGAPVSHDNFVMISENNSVTWEMAKAGYGLAVLPDVLCNKERELERVLPDLEPWAFPVWLVSHRELKTNRRIRVVFDMLAEQLSDMLQR